MKKIPAIILSSLMLFSMAACSSSQENGSETEKTTVSETKKESTKDKEKSKKSEKSEKTKDKKEVKDSDLVKVVMPSAYYVGFDKEDIIKSMKNKGYKDYEIKNDGTVTVTMTEKQRKELLKTEKDLLDDSINDITKGEAASGEISSVTYDSKIKTFTVKVKGASYSDFVAINALIFFDSSVNYQVINGEKEKNVDVIVRFVDKDSGKVLATKTYQQYLKGQFV